MPIFLSLVFVGVNPYVIHQGATLAGKRAEKGIDYNKNLFGAHMKAMLVKRLLTFRRDKKMWAFIVIVPALFVLVGIIILLVVKLPDEPSLLLTTTVSPWK